ncbi:sugar phosphate isomerase/epimerase family protein [Clostridium rectalis]|uniref:sugar phosphate isomerase/epimerase family protein n=1 Tax=Clostridium rectalis TaxID=2040295 RepID=UPI000F644104|nr:sugar phosphate isomerase/epimerase family protein [Clostridium rectalis]
MSNRDGVFDVGIFSWFGYMMPLPERLKLIKEVGFDSVIIWWEDELGDKVIKKEDMPKMVEDFGLKFENIHAPFCGCNDIWGKDKDAKKKFVENNIRWIEDCKKYNIDTMVMHVTELCKIKKPNDSGLECVEKIVKAAEKNNIKLAIENTDSSFIVNYILSNIHSDNLGLCFDTSHFNICKSWFNEYTNLLKLYPNKLFATHISDNDGDNDRHWVPFDGIIEWKEIKDTFPLRSFKESLCLEVVKGEQDKFKNPKEFLEKAYSRISKLNRYFSK